MSPFDDQAVDAALEELRTLRRAKKAPSNTAAMAVAFVLAVALFALVVLSMGAVSWLAWNAIAPVFGGPPLTFWQATAGMWFVSFVVTLIRSIIHKGK
jgi:cell division protein FtsX